MVRTYISPNILDYQCNGIPFICRAKELKEMAKTGDYQAIILDRLEIDFIFNDIIGITEYDVNVIPLSGREIGKVIGKSRTTVNMALQRMHACGFPVRLVSGRKSAQLSLPFGG